MHNSGSTLDPVRFGLALGLTCGVGVLFLGTAATLYGWGSLWVDLLATVYPGFKTTFLGSFVGGAWATVDGFIGGWLFAWFYNKL